MKIRFKTYTPKLANSPRSCRGLKKNLALKTRKERLDLLDWGDSELSIKTQAELLNLNRTSLYYKPVEPSPEELIIKHRIDELYTKYPFFGSRRIKEHLEVEGLLINRKAVQRHMREMGIEGIHPGPNTSVNETCNTGSTPICLEGFILAILIMSGA